MDMFDLKLIGIFGETRYMAIGSVHIIWAHVQEVFIVEHLKSPIRCKFDADQTDEMKTCIKELIALDTLERMGGRGDR
jgi:hypothetical protein